ncbi:hypothetical protein [uncultured Methanobrevibacter sp.]|uniref:hypothetical protein n=1 Tax=uncultured Methanobrevibacter sp. TaxID=253161 RepID=UPI00258E7A9D|nr:hypothetical protein [uncultured Methanobrevibacter sp.]
MIANRVSTIAERKRNINFIVSFVNITLSFQNKNRPVPLFLTGQVFVHAANIKREGPR